MHIAQCQNKKSEYCQIFSPYTGSGQQYVHRQKTIDTTVLSPHGDDRSFAIKTFCFQTLKPMTEVVRSIHHIFSCGIFFKRHTYVFYAKQSRKNNNRPPAGPLIV